MDIIFETLGVIAGVCVALPSIPQIWKTFRSKNVKGLSLPMFYIWLTGGLCFMAYGWYIWQKSGAAPTLMISNIVSSTCSLTMIILILKYKKN